MLKWFRKKPVADREAQEFFDRGARFGLELIASFEQFMEGRFGRLHENYLDVLRGNFRDDIQRVDVPPLESARANYKNFLDEVSQLKPTMKAEIMLYMDRWLENAENIGIRGQIEQMFQTEVSNFCANLSVDGLKLFTDYAVPLKDANNAWRKAYPELARQRPDTGEQ